MSDLLKESIEALNQQQFDEAILKRVLKDIQKLGKDEEAIKTYLNVILPKIIGLSPTPKTKAYLTDKFLQQIMGTAALDEIPGLVGPDGVNIESLKKIQKGAFGDTSELEKALGFNPSIQFEEIGEAGTYSPDSGTTYNKAFLLDDRIKTQALGTGFHEPSHKVDHISTAIQVFRSKPKQQELRRINAKYTPDLIRKIQDKVQNRVIDNEVLEFFKDANLAGYSRLKRNADIAQLGELGKPVKSIEQLVKEYKNKTPDKLKDTEEALSSRGLPHMGESDFNRELKKANIKDPTEVPFLKLQEIFSGKEARHWLNKNFPLEGVLGVAKEGIKGIKSVAPYLKTAGKVGLPLAAAASNYAEAREQGLPAPLAAAYAGVEEVNPLPISGIDYYKGMEKAAEGRRKNIESMYMPAEMKAEQEFLEKYMNSPASKDKAYGTLRTILKNDVDEELIKRLLPKRVVTPFKPED